MHIIVNDISTMLCVAETEFLTLITVRLTDRLTLTLSSGEAWQEIMLACVDGPCDPHIKDPDEVGCGTVFAIPYFVSFYVLCSFLVSNELVC